MRQSARMTIAVKQSVTDWHEAKLQKGKKYLVIKGEGKRVITIRAFGRLVSFQHDILQYARSTSVSEARYSWLPHHQWIPAANIMRW